MVGEFHRIYGHPLNYVPEANIGQDLEELRIRLIEEELQELKEAIASKDIVEIADALADLRYFVEGAAWVYGINLDMVTAEVHRSNLTKLGEDGRPIYREDGKVIKGPNYEPPDVEGVLAKQIQLVELGHVW